MTPRDLTPLPKDGLPGSKYTPSSPPPCCTSSFPDIELIPLPLPLAIEALPTRESRLLKDAFFEKEPLALAAKGSAKEDDEEEVVLAYSKVGETGGEEGGEEKGGGEEELAGRLDG